MISAFHLGRLAFALSVLLAWNSSAMSSSCTQNASASVDCSDLAVNANTNLITIGAGITVSSLYANAFEMQGGSAATLSQLTIDGVIDVPNGAGGNTALVNRNGNTISNILISETGVVQGQWSAIYNEWGPATIGTITNLGIVSATQTHYAMYNDNGVIGTLNNLQNSTGSGGALHYSGKLPTNYNVVVYGDRFGQLAVNSGDHSGVMMFDIFAGDASHGVAASTLNTRVYEDVVTGVSSSSYSNVFTDGAAFGSYNGAAWKLTNAEWRGGSATSWDLTVLNFGADLAEPQSSVLEQVQSKVRDSLSDRLGYDCVEFDKDGFCVSMNIRYSGAAEGQEMAGVLSAAKQMDSGIRIGAFVDARMSSDEIGGVQMKAGLPLIGLFAAYSENPDGTGFKARFAGAYELGKALITRSNLLGSAASVSASADIENFGIAQRVGWGVSFSDKSVFTPYLGLRHTAALRGAYNEPYRPDVIDDPFAYDLYSQRRTTGTLGADLESAINANTALRLGIGWDYDFTHQEDVFSAHSDLLGDMTYANDMTSRPTRFFGSAGLGYVIEKNKILMLDGHLSQTDYGDQGAYSLMAGYQMAF